MTNDDRRDGDDLLYLPFCGVIHGRVAQFPSCPTKHRESILAAVSTRNCNASSIARGYPAEICGSSLLHGPFDHFLSFGP
jgi:hypothetical protein